MSRPSVVALATNNKKTELYYLDYLETEYFISYHSKSIVSDSWGQFY